MLTTHEKMFLFCLSHPLLFETPCRERLLHFLPLLQREKDGRTFFAGLTEKLCNFSSDSVLMTKPAADIFYEDELFSTTEDDEDDEDSKAGSLSSPSVATSSSTASSKLTTGCSTLLSTSVAAPPPPLSTSERSQPLGALLQVIYTSF